MSRALYARVTVERILDKQQTTHMLLQLMLSMTLRTQMCRYPPTLDVITLGTLVIRLSPCDTLATLCV